VSESCEQDLGAGLLDLLGCGDDTKLLHQTEVVIAEPALRDLAILEPKQL
jgi:hypothetical protein